MTYAYTSPKAIAIAEALQRRYPCAALPTGALTDIGVEFGVSRQYVSQIASHIGVIPGQSGPRHPRPRRFCGSCGTELSRGSKATTCRACTWVEIECSNCNALVRRSASTFARNMQRAAQFPDGTQGAYQGRAFCNRSCFGSWTAKNYGWGSDYAKRKKQEVPSD